MSEVKRLSLDMEYPFQYREDTEGNLCYYADYAALKEQFDFKQNLTEQVVALQKQCDGLAAEAGYLRGEIKQHSESVHFCGVCGKDDPCKNDDVCWSLNHPTPATDAYLNSVRAEGVEMLLASLPPHYTARADIEQFAAKLRPGKDGE